LFQPKNRRRSMRASAQLFALYRFHQTAVAYFAPE
jgi:hypothetical protein